MQRRGAPRTSLEKYRPVPRPKVPVEDDEVRVSMAGRIRGYVTYAEGLLKEKGKKRITIKATGNAITTAIKVVEILKLKFPDLHQENIIGTTRSIDTYEPVEVGLDQVTHERNVAYMEIAVAVDPKLVNVGAVGYQAPVKTNAVESTTESTENARTFQKGGRRGGYRGYAREHRGGMGRQYGDRYDGGGPGGRSNYMGNVPRRGGFRGRGRRYRGGGAYKGGGDASN